MRTLPIVTLFAALTVSACVAPRETPRPAPPVPVPTAAPTPRPAPLPVPEVGADWRDWPVTPGNWSYRPEARGSLAIYGGTDGGGALVLQCLRASREVLIAVGGVSTGSLTIRTSSTMRALPVVSGRAVLAASDPLLDAMGYSRGRFIVEGQGLPTLVVPAWPEVLRVAEDCRG